MRLTLILLLALFLSGRTQAADPAGWELVWNDEFDGSALDLSKWEFEVNANGGGNNELQYYITNNVTVSNGLLRMEARQEHYTGPQGTREFTSSRIRTRRKGDWTCGRFDIRARLPQGQGIWPAIWMLPTENRYGGWPHGGEIDIMELLGHKPSQVHGTLHYSATNRRHASRGTNYVLAGASFADDFHVFRLDWETNAMRWYIDDQLYQTQTRWTSGTNAFPAPFDQKFHLLLNVAVGGNWPGKPDATTRFPQAMTVDYVRVYRRR